MDLAHQNDGLYSICLGTEANRADRSGGIVVYKAMEYRLKGKQKVNPTSAL